VDLVWKMKMKSAFVHYTYVSVASRVDEPASGPNVVPEMCAMVPNTP